MISPSVCVCECPLLKLGSYTPTDSGRWGVIFLNKSFPGISAGRICLLSRRPGFDSWVVKIPWRRKWLPTYSILALRIPWTEEPGKL